MDLTVRAAQLAGERRPFVRATLVRAQQPTSSHAGDQAILLTDGTIEGFVGGQCAQNSVREAALGALRSGESVLLRILPDGAAAFPDSPGATVVVNPCLSGGAMEIFLEPRLPRPVIALMGATPIADAVAAFAAALDFQVIRADAGAPGATAVIIASLGGEEARAIRTALDAGVGYIGLVASRVRGAAVLDQLELTPDERGRVHTPAGLPIGAETAAEIALSIMADVVRAVRCEHLTPAGEDQAPAAIARPVTAVDPVCGMTVTVAADTPHLLIGGQDHWFCSPGCRGRYEREHAGCS